MSLWRFECRKKGLAWPGHETIAACLGTDTKAVRRMISELVAHGYLTIADRGRRGRGHSAAYELHPIPRAKTDWRADLLEMVRTAKGQSVLLSTALARLNRSGHTVTSDNFFDNLLGADEGHEKLPLDANSISDDDDSDFKISLIPAGNESQEKGAPCPL
jgi:hypothetical protein